MAELQLVDTMSQIPGHCLLCNCVPKDETKEVPTPLPAVHAVGLDVDWGNSVYICWNCAGLIADLVDRPAEEKVLKVTSRLKFEKARADKATQRVDELEKRIKVMVEGRKAVKASKEELAKEKANG